MGRKIKSSLFASLSVFNKRMKTENNYKCQRGTKKKAYNKTRVQFGQTRAGRGDLSHNRLGVRHRKKSDLSHDDHHKSG